jgi:transposase
VPGIGKILSLVFLYEIHQIDRFASVQEFASYARLVKCSKESGGKRLSTSGKNRQRPPQVGLFRSGYALLA